MEWAGFFNDLLRIIYDKSVNYMVILTIMLTVFLPMTIGSSQSSRATKPHGANGLGARLAHLPNEVI
jgi:hypothetical protein